MHDIAGLQIHGADGLRYWDAVAGADPVPVDIQGHDCITVTIGVDEKAVNAGGLNLFGEGFGDFDQALVLKIGYLID